MFLFLLFSCGDDQSMAEPLDTNSGVFTEPVNEQREIETLQKEMEQTKKDLRCISVYINDRQMAQKATDQWNQPGISVYEKSDCVPMYTATVEIPAE